MWVFYTLPTSRRCMKKSITLFLIVTLLLAGCTELINEDEEIELNEEVALEKINDVINPSEGNGWGMTYTYDMVVQDTDLDENGEVIYNEATNVFTVTQAMSEDGIHLAVEITTTSPETNDIPVSIYQDWTQVENTIYISTAMEMPETNLESMSEEDTAMYNSVLDTIIDVKMVSALDHREVTALMNSDDYDDPESSIGIDEILAIMEMVVDCAELTPMDDEGDLIMFYSEMTFEGDCASSLEQDENREDDIQEVFWTFYRDMEFCDQNNDRNVTYTELERCVSTDLDNDGFVFSTDDMLLYGQFNISDQNDDEMLDADEYTNLSEILDEGFQLSGGQIGYRYYFDEEDNNEEITQEDCERRGGVWSEERSSCSFEEDREEEPEFTGYWVSYETANWSCNWEDTADPEEDYTSYYWSCNDIRDPPEDTGDNDWYYCEYYDDLATYYCTNGFGSRGTDENGEWGNSASFTHWRDGGDPRDVEDDEEDEQRSEDASTVRIEFAFNKEGDLEFMRYHMYDDEWMTFSFMSDSEIKEVVTATNDGEIAALPYVVESMHEDEDWESNELHSEHGNEWVITSNLDIAYLPFEGDMDDYKIELSMCSEEGEQSEDDSEEFTESEEDCSGLMSILISDAMNYDEDDDITFNDNDNSGTLSVGDMISVSGDVEGEWNTVRLYSISADAHSDENPVFEMPGFTGVVGVLALLSAALLRRKA